MQVKEIMTGQVQCCTPDTNLAQAIEIMWNGDCGVLPVVEDGRLAGVITDRDIGIALGTRNRTACEIIVRDAATMTVYTCEAEDDVYTAMDVMQTARVRRVPVVDREGRLEGMITLCDLASGIEREHGSALNEELLGTLKAITTRRRRTPPARMPSMASLAVAS